VDQVGQQRHAAGQNEDQRLRGRGDTEYEEREQDGSHALARALDRVVDQPMRVTVGVGGGVSAVKRYGVEQLRTA
jgi:hypothetical protein